MVSRAARPWFSTPGEQVSALAWDLDGVVPPDAFVATEPCFVCDHCGAVEDDQAADIEGCPQCGAENPRAENSQEQTPE